MCIEYQGSCGIAGQPLNTTVPTRQDHFHQFGPLGLYFRPCRHLVCVHGKQFPRKRKHPLLSSAHWHQLETVLREQNDVRVLLIVSECPVVADSPIDAAVKAKHIHCSHIKDTWSFHKDGAFTCLISFLHGNPPFRGGRQFLCAEDRGMGSPTIYDTNAERHVSKETAGDLDAAAELLIAKTNCGMQCAKLSLALCRSSL